jgi:hypothetical protein
MKKLFFTVLCLSLYAFCFADNGEIGTSYDGPIKDSYGECVHNSYYDADTGGTECGGQASASQQ